MFTLILSKNLVRKFLSSFVLAAFLVTGAGMALTGPQTTYAAERVDVLIGFGNTPGQSEQALVRAFGGEISHSFHLVPAIAASVPSSALSGLRNHPLVKVVELDGTVYAIDAELDNTWGVKRIGAGTVHDGGNKGMGVKVAVIDSGIDYTHPDLDANFAGGYDFVNNDTDPMDDNGHGTHVAGTVAAEDNDTGVVGVAPEARLYALKVLDSGGGGSWSNVIAALQWAVDNGIQVTNNSYGAGSDPGSTVQAAFDNSAAAGIYHAAAAGNSGNCAGKGDNVGYPAKYDSVIAVAATNKNDSRPCFSSTGPAVELAAPGVKINSTQLGGGYVEFNGTSMASPHVAGAAALVISAGIADSNGDGLINDEVRQALNDTAEDLGDEGKDPKYGWGLVSAALAVAAVGPADPSVNVDLSTDKTDYVAGEDTTAVITAAVTDENGDAITGLDSSAFATMLNGIAVSVTFTETATSGTYTGELDISALSAGTHSIEVTVTDTRDVSGTGSVSFNVVDPSVNVALSTDKTDYVAGEDTTAVLTAVVSDELGAAISGLTSSAFVTILDGTEVSVTFNETATTGVYTGDLDISGLVEGSYTVEVTVTDTRSVSGSDAVSFIIGSAPTEATAAIVDSITYSTTGGKNNDRHLDTKVAIVDDLGNPVAGATVSITLSHDSGTSWNGTGTTGTDGMVTFSLRNAPSGCYETTVTDVTAEGLTWDGLTPANGFCK